MIKRNLWRQWHCIEDEILSRSRTNEQLFRSSITIASENYFHHPAILVTIFCVDSENVYTLLALEIGSKSKLFPFQRAYASSVFLSFCLSLLPRSVASQTRGSRDSNRVLSRVTDRHQGLKIFSSSIIRVAALNTGIYIQHIRIRVGRRACMYAYIPMCSEGLGATRCTRETPVSLA